MRPRIARSKPLRLRTIFSRDAWTEGEDEYIRANFTRESPERVASTIGRSVAEVIERAEFLRKKHGKDWLRR